MLKTACGLSMLLSICFLSLKAQTIDKLIGEQPWHIMETLDGFVAGHPEETFALYEIPKEGFGILLINSKGQVKWKTNLKEKPFQMARIENNIVVLTGDKTGFSAGTNNFNAVLVNPENGKILLQKIILRADNSSLVVPILYTTKTGNFLKIGLRYSNMTRGMKMAFGLNSLGKLLKNYSQINKVQILSLDKNLEIANTQNLQFSSTGLLDAGSDMDIEGNILYAGYNDDKHEVTVYQFPDGKPTPDKQIRIAVNAKKLDLIKEMNLLASKQHASTVYFATSYKNEDKDYIYEIDKLDFTTSSKMTVSDILDKKYRKALESQPFDKFKGIRKPDIDDIDDLSLTRIVEAGDRVIVCKDIQRLDVSVSNSTMYVGGNGIISVYDAGMKKLYERIIPKKYKSYLPFGLGIDVHGRDGLVYFVTNDSEGGYMKAEVLFGKMDINSGNIVSIEHLEKDEIGKAEPADTKNIIWFKDRIIVSYMKLKGMMSWAYTNAPALYKY